MASMDLTYGDDKSDEDSHENLFFTQNRFEPLNGGNGGNPNKEENGLHTVNEMMVEGQNKHLSEAENVENGIHLLNNCEHGYTTVKRKRVNTDGKSTQNISDNEYKEMSTDNKLTVMFKEMKCISQKVDDSLLLHCKVHNMERFLSDYDHRLRVLEYKSIDLEARSRRNNLLFNGIIESRDENCLSRIEQFLSEQLQIDNCPQFPRAHRLGKYKRDSIRPIIVYFLDYRDTVHILSQANKLKGTKFSVNRDFPKEITNARKRLWPEYKRLRQTAPDSKTSIVYPARLVSNGLTVADEFPE